MTTSIRTYSSRILVIDGKIIVDDECCCGGDCPECVAIGDMPIPCYFDITTPLGVYRLPALGTPTWVQELRGAECWRTLHVEFQNNKCIGVCGDYAGESEVTPDLELCSTNAFDCCCEPLVEGLCPEGAEAAGPMTEVWSGAIKWAYRDLIDAGYAELWLEQNCETGQKYRKMNWRYRRTNNLMGRFVGTQEVEIKADCDEDEGTPNVRCFYALYEWNVSDTSDFGSGPEHACDECPQFNNLSDEPYDAEHPWGYPGICGGWMLDDLPAGGLQYHTDAVVEFSEASFVAVSDWAASVSVSALYGDALAIHGTGLRLCQQIAEDVNSSVWEHEELFTFAVPSTWTYWECDPLFPASASCPYEPVGVPYPTAGVTVIPAVDGTSAGSVTVQVNFAEPCVVTNPNEAVPC